MASKFKASFKTISNHLKVIDNKYCKKKRAPKYIEKQLDNAPTRTRRSYRLMLIGDFELVMDDKEYFLLHRVKRGKWAQEIDLSVC